MAATTVNSALNGAPSTTLATVLLWDAGPGSYPGPDCSGRLERFWKPSFRPESFVYSIDPLATSCAAYSPGPVRTRYLPARAAA